MDGRRKSILRENTGRFSTTNNGQNATLHSSRRRVSFNPEVTLHKIDLVLSSSPALGTKRRRTMDAAEVVYARGGETLRSPWITDHRVLNLASTEEGSGENSLLDDMDAAGTEVLHDSSDDEHELGEDGSEHRLQYQKIDLGRINPTSDQLVVLQTVGQAPALDFTGMLPNSVAVMRDYEETMELTGQIKQRSPSSVAAAAIVADYELFGGGVDSEPEMELTRIMPPPSTKPPQLQNAFSEPHIDQRLVSVTEEQNQSNLSHVESDHEGSDMELTQSLGLSKTVADQGTLQEAPEDDEELEMELTQHRSVTVDRTVDKNGPNTAVDTSAENEQDEHDMEFTQVVVENRITAQENNDKSPAILQEAGSQEVDSTMEITQVATTITFPVVTNTEHEVHNSNIKESTEKDNSQAELTQDERAPDELVQEEEVQEEHRIIHSARPLVITTKVPLADPDGEDVDSSKIMDSNFEANESLDSVLEVPLQGSNAESQGSEYDDEMDSYLPVELSDFLADIGIAFLEDEDVDVRMDTLSNEFASVEHKPSDYAKAYAKLQLYNLYVFACEELTNTSKESAELFKEFNNVIRENNPDIFRKFYRADESERANYRLKFHMVKQFARYQSEKIWYEWRIQTTETVIQRLEEKYDGLEEDRQRLINDLAMIEEIYTHVNSECQRMEDNFKAFEKRENELNQFTPEELEVVRQKYDGLSTQLSQVSQELESKHERALSLELSLQKLEELKEKYLQEMNRNMILLNERKKFQHQDVVRLTAEYKLLVKLLDIDIVSFQGKELQFLLDKSVLININLDDVLNLDNISFELTRESRFHFETLQERVKQIWMLMPSANVLQVYRNFAKVYCNLKQLDEDLFLIGLKFRLQFDSATKSGNSSDDGTISLLFTWFDFESKMNAVVHLMIALGDLVVYPPAFKIRVERVSTNTKWKSRILQEMVKNGLFNSETLTDASASD